LSPDIDDLIERTIDDLEQFGERFSELIESLQALRDRF
jgi:ABC-type transporter Mla subunit MlaD